MSLSKIQPVTDRRSTEMGSTICGAALPIQDGFVESSFVLEMMAVSAIADVQQLCGEEAKRVGWSGELHE